MSLKQPCGDVFAAFMAAAAREWLEHCDERRRSASACNEAGRRDGGIQRAAGTMRRPMMLVLSAKSKRQQQPRFFL
jgi:hypothetical protein